VFIFSEVFTWYIVFRCFKIAILLSVSSGGGGGYDESRKKNGGDDRSRTLTHFFNFYV
jgi:hypothetical protein